MSRTRLYALAGSLAMATLTVAAAEPTLHYQVPDGWRAEQPRSSMRLAQFVLPHAAGDTEDGQVVIFFFGQGQGGSVQANLERWASQMTQTGGRPGTLKDGKTSNFMANGHQVTVLDIAGTYVDTMGGGPPKPGSHMKAAVVETPAGPYFVKLTAPEKTAARWDAAFTSFLKSMAYK